MAVVDLPWPDRDLHPNSRAHYMKRARLAKIARHTAAMLTKQAYGHTIRVFDGMSRVPLALTFHPPDKRRRDLDGMLSASKSSLDGLADALMVNDHLFDLAIQVREPVHGGKIVVVIE